MRDVYLWIGLGVVGVSACVLLIAITRRLFDRQRERRYVPPSVLYTEVWALPEAEIEQDRHEDGPVKAGPQVRHHDEVTAWALDALSDVRKTASEDTYATLGEFAGKVASGPALIWAEMVGTRHVQGLVTA